MNFILKAVLPQGTRWSTYFRSPELLWLGLALTLSVASLTSVTFLGDRLHQAFQRDARQLLAADIIIQSDLPLLSEFEDHARHQGLRIAQTVVFPTMASHGQQSKLTSLKAVTPEYPLRGEISLQSHQKNKLSSHQAWADPALLQSMGLKPGDRIDLGDQSFVIADVIDQELDRGAAFMNFAPRIMIRHDDLNSTGLVGLGSRVTYRLLVAAPEEMKTSEGDLKISQFESWALNEIDSKSIKGVRIENLENGQPLMRKTVDRAEKFLSLVALLTAMVAAVGVALTSQRYVAKQAEVCAVWRCLGASQAQVLVSHAERFIMIGLIAGLCGVFFGWLSHILLLHWVGGLLLSELPLPSMWPALWGVLVALTLLLGFAWPPLLALSKVSPVRALRKDFSELTARVWHVALFGLGCFCVLLWWVSRDLKLAAIILGSFITASCIFMFLGYLFACVFGKFLVSIKELKPGIRLAGLRLMGRPWITALQIAALGIALMSLLLLGSVRNDLLNAWQASVPLNAPNRFLINIQPDQKESVQAMLQQTVQATELNLYPMIRGRLVQVNHHPVSPRDYLDDGAQRLIDREFNLSYTDQVPPGNKIVSGEWFTSHAENTHQVSMESGIMKTLNLKLGDQLVFEIAGQPYEVRITSARKLDWSSMRVNFFAILPKGLLEEAPQSWITSFHQNLNSHEDIDLVQRFPNITVLDVEATLKQVQDVLSKLSMAVQLLFGYTLMAGMLVLAAALASSQGPRMKEAAVLKTIGAGRDYLSRAWLSELLFIGMGAGLLSGIFASISTWLLAKYALEIDMNISWTVIFMGIGLGAMSSLCAGFWMRKKILNTPPVLILQES